MLPKQNVYYFRGHKTYFKPEFKLCIDRVVIDRVQSFTFLGSVLDTNLKWNVHVEKISNSFLIDSTPKYGQKKCIVR